jgi:hypothetical protein
MVDDDVCGVGNDVGCRAAVDQSHVERFRAQELIRGQRELGVCPGQDVDQFNWGAPDSGVYWHNEEARSQRKVLYELHRQLDALNRRFLDL